MSSVTLLESAKLSQDELAVGVIEHIVTVNRMFELLPFDGIEGNALAYNRENALGSVVVAGVGTDLVSGGVNPIDSSTGGKAPATFTPVTSALTSILGDAEVNGLIQATRSDKNDQTALQIASKAKHAGRVYQHMLINGTGSGDQFNGLINLCATSQKVLTGTNGGPISFAFLDELVDLVKDKDGQVDFITMHARTLRSYMALLRTLGGASVSDVVQLPSGKKIPAYRDIPIFKNDWIPTNQTKGGSSACSTIFAGTFDDGSRTHGISGLTAKKAMGIEVEYVGVHQSRDEKINRVKWYCGLCLFSELGLACADGITN